MNAVVPCILIRKSASVCALHIQPVPRMNISIPGIVHVNQKTDPARNLPMAAQQAAFGIVQAVLVKLQALAKSRQEVVVKIIIGTKPSVPVNVLHM
jgi:hypothetical protein